LTRHEGGRGESCARETTKERKKTSGSLFLQSKEKKTTQRAGGQITVKRREEG